MKQEALFPSNVVAGSKELRDYQGFAIESIFDYFSKHDGSPIVVMPVGSGKSLTIAEFMREANVYFPGTRFVVLAHVAELLTQNAEELMGQWPDANISFFSDALGQKELDGDIIFAGIQSIYKKAYDFRHAPDLIICDECQLIGPDADTMYRKFFDDMKVINPNIKIIGFTGTPFRAGYGMLHKGKNALFTHVAYEIGMSDLIGRGHLVPIVTPQISTHMDTEGVKMRGGDFIASQLSKKVDDAAITKACVDEIMHHGADRKRWLVFTVDIEHCGHVAAEIRSRGISCEVIHSKTPTMERNRIVDRYKNGDLRCLVNVAVFTVGFNNPSIDLLAFMRPTRSPVLYIQMAGRGMRTFPTKTDCLLLDFGGVVEELGPIDAVRIKEPTEGTGDAPIKYCPGKLPSGAICNTTLPAAAMKCNECGYEFPETGLNLDMKPTDAAALSSQLKPKVAKVSRVAYYRHKKEGKPDAMRIDYLCGFETYREWKHFEHLGRAREESCAWWRQRAANTPPNTITEALQRGSELRMPLYIHVKKIGKYHEVIGADFSEPVIEEDVVW